MDTADNMPMINTVTSNSMRVKPRLFIAFAFLINTTERAASRFYFSGTKVPFPNPAPAIVARFTPTLLSALIRPVHQLVATKGLDVVQLTVVVPHVIDAEENHVHAGRVSARYGDRVPNLLVGDGIPGVQ